MTLTTTTTPTPTPSLVKTSLKPSGLLVFLNTFGVQKEKDQKKKFHPTEAIARIKEVIDFIENCEIEIRLGVSM